MSFWDTFVRVWQVRTSVRVQEGIEDFLIRRRRTNELNSNLPTILDEIEKKNDLWEDQIKKLKNENNEN